MILRRSIMPTTNGRGHRLGLHRESHGERQNAMRCMNNDTDTSVKKVQIESACPHTAPLKITVGASQTPENAMEARKGALVAARRSEPPRSRNRTNAAEIAFTAKSLAQHVNWAAISRR